MKEEKIATWKQNVCNRQQSFWKIFNRVDKNNKKGEGFLIKIEISYTVELIWADLA